MTLAYFFWVGVFGVLVASFWSVGIALTVVLIGVALWMHKPEDVL